MKRHHAYQTWVAVFCLTSIGGLARPTLDAAMPDLLVAADGTGAILRYDGETGAFVEQFVPPGSGGLCQGSRIGPGAMVFGPDGHLYVTCAVGDVGLVLRYDGTTGDPLPGPLAAPGTAEFVRDESGELIDPHGLTFGPDGHLYVSSQGAVAVSPGDADRVLRYDGQTGAYIDMFVETGSGGLDVPMGIVFGPWDGDLYVVSLITNEVLRYDGETGAFLDVFAAAGGLASMVRPVDLRFGRDGNLYVANGIGANVARIHWRTGEAIDNFVPPGFGGLDHATGLLVGPDGNLYVADYYESRIMRYDGRTGAMLPSAGAAPRTAEFVTPGSGGLAGPYGLAFFPTGAPAAPDALGAADAGNRYLRVEAPLSWDGGAFQEVVRVRCVSLDGFPSFGTEYLYVGAPYKAPEENSAEPGLNFTTAPLTCEPYYHDWSSLGTIAIHGAEIMPGSDYELQRASAACADLSDELCWSVPVIVHSCRWGDTVAPFETLGGVPQPDFNDIAAVVKKFLAAPDAPVKVYAQKVPNIVFPTDSINFKDIAATVSAFVGLPYAQFNDISGPCDCPSLVVCETTPCTSHTHCAGGYCNAGFCTDACGRCVP